MARRRTCASRPTRSCAVKRTLAEILSKHTGKSVEQIGKDIIERDRYMTADEAKEYGLIDEILEEGKSDSKKKGK